MANRQFFVFCFRNWAVMVRICLISYRYMRFFRPKELRLPEKMRLLPCRKKICRRR